MYFLENIHCIVATYTVKVPSVLSRVLFELRNIQFDNTVQHGTGGQTSLLHAELSEHES